MYPCMYIYEEAWGEILGTQWDEVASSGTSACMYSKACITLLKKGCCHNTLRGVRTPV